MTTTTILDAGAVRPIHKGAWSSTATYDTSNIVSYDGSSWMMSASSYTVGTTPVDGDTWKLLAAKGSSLGEDASTTTKGIAYLATDAEITAGTNTTKIVTPKNLSDKVSAEIADLVNSAPEALDTLNELAAALGDDPNFATTVATNIGTVSTAAAAAQSTADSAVTAAASAQSTADTAVTNAATAQGTANTAVSDAAAAQSTANTAVSNAATAQSAATAIATTDTLGRVSVNGGLSITDEGALSISMDVQDVIDDASALLDDVSISAGALKVVRSDSSGKISAGYVPLATSSAVGGIKASTSVAISSAGVATVPTATESLAGIVERATNEEASAGTETTRYITPYQLKTYGVPSGAIVMWSGTTDTVPTGWALCDGENNTPDLRDRFVVGAGSIYAVGGTGGSTTATVSGTVDATTLTVAQMPSHGHSLTRVLSASTPSVNLGWNAEIDGPVYAYNVGTYNCINVAGSSQPHTHSFSGSGSTNLPPYYALAYIMKL